MSDHCSAVSLRCAREQRLLGPCPGRAEVAALSAKLATPVPQLKAAAGSAPAPPASRVVCVTWNARSRRARLATPAALLGLLDATCGALAARAGALVAVLPSADAAERAVVSLHAQTVAAFRGLRLFVALVELEDGDTAECGSSNEQLLAQVIARDLRSPGGACGRRRGGGTPTRPADVCSAALPLVAGLLLVLDFVSEEEERVLLQAVDVGPWSATLSRRVQHFGAGFDYGTRAPLATTAEAPQGLLQQSPIASSSPLSRVAAELARRGFVGDSGDARVALLRLSAPVAGLRALDALLPVSADSSRGPFPSVDQVTLNEYAPGSGIAPHVDTHAGFEDGIVSLSLGADIVMDIARLCGRSVCERAEGSGHGDPEDAEKGGEETGDAASIVLPRRSLLVLRGPARLCFSHGIAARKTDCVDGRVHPRGRRVSATFRVVRPSSRPCTCAFRACCGGQQPDVLRSPRLRAAQDQGPLPPPSPPLPRQQRLQPSSDGVRGLALDAAALGLSGSSVLAPPELEQRFVHALYNDPAVARHFSDTRHSRWPRVEAYMRALPTGALVFDVGCGNGKYLGSAGALWELGLDRSAALAAICGARHHEACVADALTLPLRGGLADAVLCVALLHHVSTRPRRVALLRELLRLACGRGGQVLVYAWAQEQGRGSRRAFASQDVLVPWCLRAPEQGPQLGRGVDGASGSEDVGGSAAEGAVFQRYCHVLVAGELEGLAKEAAESAGLRFVGRGAAAASSVPGPGSEALAPMRLVAAGRRGDAGIEATAASVPDAAVAPVRVAAAVCARTEAVADPITLRLVSHAAGAGAGGEGGGEGQGAIVLLDAWWERDNWCVLLQRQA